MADITKRRNIGLNSAYRNLKKTDVTPHGSSLMTNQKERDLVTLTQFEEVMIQIYREH